MIIFAMAKQPPVGQGFLTLEAHDHNQTHHTREDSSGRMNNPTQRPLPDNTQYSEETDIHALGGIRTRNPNRRADTDPRPRPRGTYDNMQIKY
jgi:hypothetical protein